MIDHEHDKLLHDIAIHIEDLVRVSDVKTLDLWMSECAERALLRECAEGREPWIKLWEATKVTHDCAGERPMPVARLRIMTEAWDAARRTPGLTNPKASGAACAAANAAQGLILDTAEAAARGDDGEDLEERQWQLKRLEEMSR